MVGLTPELIIAALAPTPPTARIIIGYSGGVDSHVLLHLAAAILLLRERITAVYVHHGLQVQAGQWAAHCQQTAAHLAVGFQVLHVNAQPQPGESPEEAARNARYTALKALLAKDDVLLVAQHREDQLETVLLQLFRGSGLRGLSGMPERMAFGEGVLVRPLLAVAKQAIADYADRHGLVWVEDPSNQHSDYDRNFLRNEIVPLLKRRWPALDKTVARSAGHCAEAEAVLSDLAGRLAAPVFNPADQTLTISRLLAYSEAEQKRVIRHWLQGLHVKMPSQKLLAHLQTEVLAARPDASPVVAIADYCLRRYQDKLYCLPPHSLSLATGVWPQGQAAFVLNARQCLQCVPASTGIALAVWQQSCVEVRARQGGEKIRLPHRQGRHSLKKLFQEAGIPPWERELVPLVYLDGQLAAVGGYWLAAEFYCQSENACLRICLSKLPKAHDEMAFVD
ncbi:tRNA lysidine(34) synthetase TilS [Methylovulum psychrotolerans]|uniref:tRNA(Ile)-lysidine synthase n=1 Tax=Methylovulum psychrotolerans TaxID=1704499 RepID=A0A2S5CJT6_9GAMM|nr:tRNA lysidine(34) synthetase TilS [Methylovulum psychrotolerans]POZ51075.1 tRNA lysidine(34) synthetase TilS [Methylovulum psychrotolerans]